SMTMNSADPGSKVSERSSLPENLLDLEPAAAKAVLAAAFSDWCQPSYRADQVLRRLWINATEGFQSMTELPVALREQLKGRFSIPRLELVTEQKSTDGTRKFLFRLRDGQTIETVAIPEGDRMTLCISSQAGCALQCAF